MEVVIYLFSALLVSGYCCWLLVAGCWLLIACRAEKEYGGIRSFWYHFGIGCAYKTSSRGLHVGKHNGHSLSFFLYSCIPVYAYHRYTSPICLIKDGYARIISTCVVATCHNFPRGCGYIKSFKYIGLGASCKQGLLIRDVDGDDHDVSLCYSSIQGIDQGAGQKSIGLLLGPIPAIPNQPYKLRVCTIVDMSRLHIVQSSGKRKRRKESLKGFCVNEW